MDHEEKEGQEKMKSGQSLHIPDLCMQFKIPAESSSSSLATRSACTEVYIYYTGTNMSQTEISTLETFIYDSKHQAKATCNVNGAYNGRRYAVNFCSLQ